MGANGSNSAATHFGRQMKKERLANNWSLRRMAAESGVDYTTSSRIETGDRPANERVAAECDRTPPALPGCDFLSVLVGFPASYQFWSLSRPVRPKCPAKIDRKSSGARRRRVEAAGYYSLCTLGSHDQLSLLRKLP
jgi:hypothetical protein